MNLKEKVYSELFKKKNELQDDEDIFGLNSYILEEYQK